MKQFEGMNVATARKNKEQEEDALDLKNKRNPKATKEKPLKEVPVVQPFQTPIKSVANELHAFCLALLLNCENPVPGFIHESAAEEVCEKKAVAAFTKSGKTGTLLPTSLTGSCQSSFVPDASSEA